MIAIQLLKNGSVEFIKILIPLSDKNDYEIPRFEAKYFDLPSVNFLIKF